MHDPEAAVRRRSSQMFLKMSQFYKKTPVLDSLFDKDAGLKAGTFIEKSLQHRCFPVNIAKFFTTACFIKKVAVSNNHKEMLDKVSEVPNK